LVSVVGKVLQLFDRKERKSTDFLWKIAIVNSVIYTIFSGAAYRMIPYSILFSLPLIVDFGMNGNFTKSFYRPLRILITLFISIVFVFFTAVLDHSDNESKDIDAGYTKQELFEVIDNLSENPIVIMAHSNDGPALLYYTKHSVVGAPYHRQTEGIISSYKVMEDEYDEKTVRDILKTTGSSYIFIRKKQYQKSDLRSLAKMITDNVPPKWIEIVELPPKFKDVIIAKIKGLPL
jgi:uncharacterized membrane protein